ncbi:hypothetical protein K1719_022821 [Acacia pycnantha]|nr:hypothetical protein K1719_022821 [Acacia pycnantha]
MKINVGDLFFVSLMSNLKFMLLAAMGAVLALQRFNILGHEATKPINKVSFYVFNPALYLSNLSQTLTRKTMAMLWFMPLNILMSYIIGSILGWILLKIVEVPHTLRRLVFGCCVAGNIGSLMLVLVTSICEEKGGPFGAGNVCKDQALAYSSLSFAINTEIREISGCKWSHKQNIEATANLSGQKRLSALKLIGGRKEEWRRSELHPPLVRLCASPQLKPGGA